MAAGVEHWRANWPVCAGTVLWQLNDCWPVTSWAAIDGDGREKPLYHELKRLYADRLLTLQPRDGGLVLAAVNQSAEDWAGSLTLRRMTVEGAVVGGAVPALAAPARTVGRIGVPGELLPAGPKEFLVADAAGLRALHFPAPDREIPYPRPQFEVRTEPGTVTARTLVRDLLLQADRLDPAEVAEAVRYLTALGHRRIARVGGAAVLGHTGIRTAAFDEAARTLELAAAWQMATDFSGESGARATRSLLTAAPRDRPTAIVYDNDIMAIAGLAVAAEMGLRVPADVSLLAWDDSQLCRLRHPTLSAMSHDVHGFGAEVAHTLFGMIAGGGPGSHPVPTPVGSAGVDGPAGVTFAAPAGGRTGQSRYSQVAWPVSKRSASRTWRRAIVPRTVRDVVFVDGVRTPFGKAGPKGIYHETRADDLVVKAIRELLRRNPGLDPKKIDEVAIAATTQIGDQGLTLGRTAGILAGLPQSVPGYSIDRMCAGALTAVTTTAGSIAFGAYDAVIAGGVEHMGRHPMGEGVDPNPRFVSEKLVDESALFMGMTAENLHDRYPQITKLRADEYAVRSQEKAAKAYANGKIQQDLVPISVRNTNAEVGETGWGLVTADEPMRPGTTLENLAGLKTPFRTHGRVTAGNAAGLNDGATASIIASEDFARENGLPVKMRLVSYAFAGVEPEVMGYGPIPATEKALAKAGLGIGDIGLFEVNEAFAVQVLAFLDHYGIADDDARVNPWGGAIAVGHPLASSGVRLMTQLSRQFAERPDVRYGLTAMCIGMGMGGTVIWENPNWEGATN